MDIAIVDWGIVGVISISGLISLVRGFVKEAMSLVIWIAAFVVAMSFKEPVADLLVNFIALASIRQLAAWGGLFVGTLLLGAVVNFLLGKLVSSTGLSGTDRTLG
jgi:membrane protein required for colicin V production